MSQISFADAEYAVKRKKTRREVFLEEMELVVPWKVLLKIIEPHYPVAGRGRRPYALETMLRVHLMQNWFALSDPAMEEALYEIASLYSFARLTLNEPIPDETTILNFRHLLEANDLAEDILKAINALLARKGLLLKRGSIVDATIIAAPSSTKNAEGERDPEMHQAKKGNQWFFGMKAHMGVDADSGLVHTVYDTLHARILHVHRTRGGFVVGRASVKLPPACLQGVEPLDQLIELRTHFLPALAGLAKSSVCARAPWAAPSAAHAPPAADSAGNADPGTTCACLKAS